MPVLERFTLKAWLPGDEKISTARHPNVPTRQVPLSNALRAQQILKGFFVEVEGEKYALPIDSWDDRTRFLGLDMWRPGAYLPHRAGARSRAPGSKWQGKLLTWLRDNVDGDIPALYYRALLGHDLHVSTWGDLYGKHQHMGWASPFDSGRGESVRRPLDPTFQTLIDTHFRVHDCRLGASCPGADKLIIQADGSVSAEGTLAILQARRGFVENLGWLSGAKVTTAFVSEEIDELVSTTGTEYADFDYHEVGTSNTAESNAHTALQTTTSIARATGTPTDADPIYRSVATITADTTETWQEHGIFNNTSGVAMMDRNLTGGQAVVSTDQVQYTFELTKNAES